MADETTQRIYLKDYRVPNYLVDTINLFFDIQDEKTIVIASSMLRRNPASTGKNPLILNGAELVLKSISIDSKPLSASDYVINGEELSIANVPDEFMLSIETEIDPAHNTSLEGLYASGPMLCTQCEAEGFRRITYYPDRPDVMAKFTTTIEADKTKYPVLLSNGNLVLTEQAEGNRHRLTWQDPWPKPCYLFALVAGDLVNITDHFTTMSGRKVLLEIYCEAGKEDQMGHAMESLKKSMKWDEVRFGREYDLDRFMIVATPYFNSGAMENKGLNIFNDAYILGKPETATDRDLYNIESVVAHEYFHNWSGDRVTCRDWFQLSLKEGFTVFRDQEFSSDMHSPATERISNVRALRSSQFTEDAGPMAHPIRPDSFVTIDNFYTMTVYEKGSEVVRMLQTMFGREGFRKGTDLYFSRFDGQAVTCDDFVATIFEANPERAKSIDINHFKLWYSQAGTPRITAETAYDANAKTYRITLKQTVPATPRQPDKKPMFIPILVGLLDKNGADMPLKFLNSHASIKTGPASKQKLLLLKQAEQHFMFENITERPVPSFLRDFSAPVIFDYAYSDAELAFLAAHDSNPFNRWDALQQFASNELEKLIADAQNNKALHASPAFITAMGAALQNADEDGEFAALCLQLPGETDLGQMMLRQGKKIDVDAIHAAREALRKAIATHHREPLLQLYMERLKLNPMAFDGKTMGERQLKNICLAYLSLLNEENFDEMAFAQATSAKNMTDATAALGVLTNRNTPLREQAFDAFYDKWKNHKLVLDKWFSLQAIADRPDILQQVKTLMEHPAFIITNPNMVYALIRTFVINLPHFHAKDGSGYRLLADVVLKLDGLNAQIAGRIVPPLIRFNDYDSVRAGHMRSEITRMLAKADLSKNVREVAEAGINAPA
ncbi:MAG: aminopeptidase N [Alphaproteobacteria bacterium]|nr:aminopeptidase N [Alphaproteobacteria bacterium]